MPTRPEKPSVFKRTNKALQKRRAFEKTALPMLLRYTEALLRDFGENLNLYTSVELERDVKTIRHRALHEGVSFFTDTLPSFVLSVLSVTEGGRPLFHGFKKHGDRPCLFRALINEVFDDGVKQVDAIRMLLQLMMFKKLEGPPPPGAQEKQFLSWLETEIDLSNVDLSQINVESHLILKEAQRIFMTVIDGLDPADVDQIVDFLPQPGSGATNSFVPKAHRYRPDMLAPEIECWMPSYDWFEIPPCNKHKKSGKFNLNQIGRHHRSLKVPNSDYWFGSHALAGIIPESRLKYVFKTYGTLRGICIEHNIVQYRQQALKNGLVRRISRHPLTKGYINFDDQSVNGKMALKSSVDRRMATLDMKDASDRILRDLVALLGGANKEKAPPLIGYLFACSTRAVQLDAELERFIGLNSIPIHKFAPMGSSLCFPVMSLVFFSLIKAIATVKFKAPSTEVFIFGDDIICEVALVDEILKFFPSLGFVVNKDKSYWKGYFRESCGVFAWKGKDITPVRIRSLPIGTINAALLKKCLLLEGALFNSGFRNVAGEVRRDVQEGWRTPRGFRWMYVNPKSDAVGFYRQASERTSLLEWCTTSKVHVPGIALNFGDGKRNEAQSHANAFQRVHVKVWRFCSRPMVDLIDQRKGKKQNKYHMDVLSRYTVALTKATEAKEKWYEEVVTQVRPSWVSADIVA
jgi:hypothetical protein